MGGDDDEKQELSGIKWENGILIGKKASRTTPSPSWKLGFHSSSSLHPNFPMNTSVSARKIGANLWEVQPQFNFNNDDDGGGGGASLIHHRRRRHHSHDQLDEENPPDADPQPPEIETISRSDIIELPSLRQLSVGKNGDDLQHVSSASCCSSMQVTPFVKAATPIGYTIKTSTHLLKILNRIWNLEEQHSSNVALIKSLKRELDVSRAQITTLVEERKRDHQEMDELKKSMNDRKKKAAESTRDEFLEVKSLLMRERKARILLESLCDEFANGIRDYDQKVRFLQQNRGKKDRILSKNEPDRLILHVSEAWLDERVQMKCDSSQKTSISDNLCCEIETFLEAKKKQSRGSTIEADEILVNTEASLRLVSRKTDHGPKAAEPSSKSRTERIQDHGPSMSMSRTGRGSGVTEPCSKANTLMAKLVEARLESQFSKSRTLRR